MNSSNAYLTIKASFALLCIEINSKVILPAPIGCHFLLQPGIPAQDIISEGLSKGLEVIGDKFVTGLKYEQNGEEKILDIQGVFVEIGHIRNIDFVKDIIKLNDKDEIIVDKTGAASVKGIFAAGDITDLKGKQTVIACGDGSRALLSAFAYLKRGK